MEFKKCNKKVMPRPTKRPTVDYDRAYELSDNGSECKIDDSKEHRRDLCEKCKIFGKYCKDVTDADIARKSSSMCHTSATVTQKSQNSNVNSGARLANRSVNRISN